MQLFVRDALTMIAAPVQCDVDGIPKGSHDSGVSHEISIQLLLAAALYAVSVGLHGRVCMGFACHTLCMLFCVGGGVIAGLLTACLAARSESPLIVV
jgi:hypothetical protein